MADSEDQSPIKWDYYDIVLAMLDYISERWKPILDAAREKRYPDFERTYDPMLFWRRYGPDPAYDEEAEASDETDGVLICNLWLKRALIEEIGVEDGKPRQMWIWDLQAFRMLRPEEWAGIEEDWGFLYTRFTFSISEDLMRVRFSHGFDVMALRGWGLLVGVTDDQVTVTNDPDAGFWMS